LLGWVDNAQPYSAVQSAPWQTNDDYAAFAQDEFRVRSNLTLSFGLRWDISGWIRERHNQLATIDFNAPNPASRTLYPANKDSLGPRFGFAWSPLPKTVIRGGFGIVYSNSGSAIFG